MTKKKRPTIVATRDNGFDRFHEDDNHAFIQRGLMPMWADVSMRDYEVQDRAFRINHYSFAINKKMNNNEHQ